MRKLKDISITWDKTAEQKVLDRVRLYNDHGNQWDPLHSHLSNTWGHGSAVLRLARREAVASSTIEGMTTTLEGMEDCVHDGGHSLDNALTWNLYNAGVDAPVKFYPKPLGAHTLKTAHEILFNGVALTSAPGEFRRVPIEIGGGLAVSAQEIDDMMGELETFFHSDYPVFVKAAVAHAQFELIHPFLDGNGRIGRLLIPWLVKPLTDAFPISETLLERQEFYYMHLGQCRESADWRFWINDFLKWSSLTMDKVLTTFGVSS